MKKLARKSTKKSEEKTEKKTTAKKTTKKSTKTNDNVKITFRPLFSAATQFTAYLQHKVKVVDNGNEILVDKPIIDGLDGTLTIRAGEIITVTKEQFDKLDELGFIESKEQRDYRESIEKNLEPQHPERLSYDMMATNRDFNIKPRDLSKIYTDKFIVVD